MKVTLKLPRLGMNMQTGRIIEWFKRPGDRFSAGEPLYSIEADKASIEVPAPDGGRLVEIVAREGAEVAVGASICVIEAAPSDRRV